MKNPKYLCCTITGDEYNAQQFCMLLTTAIDWGFDWQIGELEDKMASIIQFNNREIFYKTGDIEFGHYGDDMDDDREHYEYDVMYIIVDGKEYHLEDANMKKLGQLGIFETGRRKPKIHIHGIDGFISKNGPLEEVRAAVASVEDGVPYYGHDLAVLVRDIVDARLDKRSSSLLTKRELEIIEACCAGLMGKEIAEKYNISLRAVNSHKTNIFNKLGLSSSVEMVRFALEHGII